MAYLVMLVTILAIMHGVVHPYPRRSTNQQTKRNLVCTKYYNQEEPVGSVKIPKEICVVVAEEEKPLSYGSTKIEKRVEVESVKSKPGPYNKKWRLPRIENEELQTVFIIGTDDY